METINLKDCKKVNGHFIVPDEGKFFLWTEGTGYWAFDLPDEEAAIRTANSVGHPEPKRTPARQCLIGRKTRKHK